MGVNQRAQIKMTDEEIDAFLHERRTMSMATIGAGGRIQLVAMWYGFVGDAIGFGATGTTKWPYTIVRLRSGAAAERDPIY